ncbi:MAG: hypothetical protein AVDCRST_MAG10-3447, partial [uncultured Acidimicrobiales bacterium]
GNCRRPSTPSGVRARDAGPRRHPFRRRLREEERDGVADHRRRHRQPHQPRRHHHQGRRRSLGHGGGAGQGRGPHRGPHSSGVHRAAPLRRPGGARAGGGRRRGQTLASHRLRLGDDRPHHLRGPRRTHPVPHRAAPCRPAPCPLRRSGVGGAARHRRPDGGPVPRPRAPVPLGDGHAVDRPAGPDDLLGARPQGDRGRLHPGCGPRPGADPADLDDVARRPLPGTAVPAGLRRVLGRCARGLGGGDRGV